MNSRSLKLNYKILSPDQVRTHMEDIENAAFSQLKPGTIDQRYWPSISGNILRHCSWDLDAFSELAKNNGISQHFFGAYNPMNPKHNDFSKFTSGKARLECVICGQSAVQLWSLNCNHSVCLKCWKRHANEKINSGMCKITCMASECTVLVDEFSLERWLGDGDQKNVETLKKFNKFCLDDFIRYHKNRYKRCINTDCQMVACLSEKFSRKSDETQTAFAVHCRCGAIYCFVCSKTWHAPVSCELVECWQKTCLVLDKETVTAAFNTERDYYEWAQGYTCPCPRCKVIIWKDGGCNHMACLNRNCSYEFCWICLEPWQSSHYSCNNTALGQANRDRERQQLKDDFAKVANRRDLMEWFRESSERLRSHETELNFYHENRENLLNGCKATQNGYILTMDQCKRVNELKLIRLAKLALKHLEIFAFFTQAPALPGTMSSNNSREKDLKEKTLALRKAQQNGHRAFFQNNNVPSISNTSSTIHCPQQNSKPFWVIELDRAYQALLETCAEGIQRNEWAYLISWELIQELTYSGFMNEIHIDK